MDEAHITMVPLEQQEEVQSILVSCSSYWLSRGCTADYDDFLSKFAALSWAAMATTLPGFITP